MLNPKLNIGSSVRRFTEPGHVYPTNADTLLTGLCTGLLTAVTISCCSSLPELITSAVDSVVVGFRIGLLSEDVRLRIEPAASLGGSWSVVIPGLKEDAATEALQRYITDKVLSSIIRCGRQKERLDLWLTGLAGHITSVQPVHQCACPQWSYPLRTLSRA